jgi:hypothetical protein
MFSELSGIKKRRMIISLGVKWLFKIYIAELFLDRITTFLFLNFYKII